VAEVAAAGEHHRQSMLVGGGNDILVAHRSARLHDGGGAENTERQPDGPQAFIYDASVNYQAAGTPLVIFAGKEYGTGSSRDWAAKGTRLLGVRAVVAESFERIHRSNLIGMGVLPLQFAEGVSWKSLNLSGAETVSINGVAGLLPRQVVSVEVTYPDGAKHSFDAKVRIDTENELDYYRNGGILHYVLRELARG
jgi:aconitate hydratase